MYVGPARSAEEMGRARRLAASVFRSLPAASARKAQEHKRFLWAEPGFPGADHVVVASVNDEIHGVVRLLPRLLRHGDESIAVGGISSVCVAESQRGRGIGRLVMDAAIQQAQRLGYELAVLFARRAVDHLYPRFDIWGIASYSRVTISFLEPHEPAIALRAATPQDINWLMEWHAASYAHCFGWIERSEVHWRFLLAGARRRRLSILIAEKRGKRIGYAVHDGTHVVELGLAAADDALEVLRAFLPEDCTVTADMPRQHAALPALRGIDLTVSSRLCEYGGHMVAVLDLAAARQRLAERIRRRATSLLLGPQVEHVDGLTLRWDGHAATVESDPLIGARVMGLCTTARVVGASLAGRVDSSLLAPGEPLDFLLLDQF